MWGASPVPISVPEVLSALQTGVVDSFGQTLLFTFASSWYTAIKHITLSKHIYQPGAILASKAKFEKYPKELQNIFTGDWSKIRKKYANKIRKMDKILVERLQAAGVKVHRLSAKDRAGFRKGLQVVYDNFRKKQSPMGKKLLRKILEYQKNKK